MTSYNASNIKALKPLEAIRQRASMYIGSVDERGIETLLREGVDNSVDELINGHGNHIEVEIDSTQGLYRVRDYGRGMPVDIYEETGESALFVLCSHVHSGGKFGSDSYKTSGGLNGVGIKATNALSDYFCVTSFRDGYSHTLEFQAGEMISEGVVKTKLPKARAKETGTELIFSPDPIIFTETDTTVLSESAVLEFIRGRSFLSSNTANDAKGNPITASFKLIYDGREHDISNPKGIVDFVSYNLGKNKAIIKEPIFLTDEFIDKKTSQGGVNSEESVKVQIALTFAQEYKSNQRFFCNTIEQRDGGRHVTGFKHGILAAVKSFIANATGFREKDREVKIDSVDCLETCFAVVSLFHSDPIYRGQDKSMLTNSNAQTFTNRVISEKLPLWMEANPKIAKAICDRIISSARARDKSKALREGAKNNDLFSMSSFGKLSDCSSTDRTECELFICEGDSAGGSIKDIRDKKTQAVYPLKGKIINTVEVSPETLYKKPEISDLIATLGIDPVLNHDELTEEDKDELCEKLRYGKIISCADADSDGAHIKCLINTFFLTYYRFLIERGYIYIAISPLYKVMRGRKVDFIKNEIELKKFFITTLKDLEFGLYTSEGDQLALNNHIIRNLATLKDTFNYISSKHSVTAETLGMILTLSGMYELNGYKDVAAALVDYYTEIGYEGIIHEEGTEADVIIGHDENGRIFCQSIDEAAYTAYYELFQSLYDLFGENVLEMVISATCIQVGDSDPEFTNIFRIIDLLDNAVSKKATIIRQKGLGEIDAVDLGLTTINPKSREMLQVQIDPKSEETVYNLMSKKTREYRKAYVKNINSSQMVIDI